MSTTICPCCQLQEAIDTASQDAVSVLAGEADPKVITPRHQGRILEAISDLAEHAGFSDDDAEMLRKTLLWAGEVFMVAAIARHHDE